MTKNELIDYEWARDQLLSGVTKMLYSFNMTVNVKNGTYTLITGTGLTDVVESMKATDCYGEIYQKFLNEVDVSIGRDFEIAPFGIASEKSRIVNKPGLL